MAHKKGDVVEMTSDALDNYGDEWAGVLLRITHVAIKYMPAAKFFAMGKPEGYHPGFDESCGDEGLYDLEALDGNPLSFSLYGWELD